MCLVSFSKFGLKQMNLNLCEGVGVLGKILGMKRRMVKIINPSLILTIQILHLQEVLFLFSSSPREIQILKA